MRSMTRWVVRNQDESTQSSTASLQILGGAPASGKSSLECMNKSKSVVTYDSDADKLRILYLLKMVPKMFTTEAELCLFLDGSIEIGWIGDYLQPLQRALRPEIFKCLAALCYDVRIIGLHSSVQAIEETANSILLLYWENRAKNKPIGKFEKIEARVVKNRDGLIGKFDLLFETKY